MGIYRKSLIICIIILCIVFIVCMSSSKLENDSFTNSELKQSGLNIILDELASGLEFREEIKESPLKEKVDYEQDEKHYQTLEVSQQKDNPPNNVEIPDSNPDEISTKPPIIPVDNTNKSTRVITDRGGFQHIIDNVNSSQILGIDISHHQSDRGEIDWEKVAGSDIKFVFIKVSEGNTYKDPYAQKHFEGARDQGLAAGGYHYARPAQPIEKDAKAEVAHFISRLKASSGDYGDLPAVLDLEDPLYPGTNGLSVEDLLKWTEIFNEEFEKYTGHKIIIYTGNWFINSWNNFNYPNNSLLKYPIWIADYYLNRIPSGGWSSWLVWQFSDKGKIDGIQGDVDLNIATQQLLTYCK